MTPRQLRDQRNRMLREAGFHDLEPTDEPTRRGLSRKGAPQKMESLSPEELSLLGDRMQVIRQFVEDPTTPWPSPMYKRMAEHLGNGLGRVQIEAAMGDAYPGWRAQARVVEWLEQRARNPMHGETVNRNFVARQLNGLSPRELVQLAVNLLEVA